jgi:hypothetical protein
LTLLFCVGPSLWLGISVRFASLKFFLRGWRRASRFFRRAKR